MPPREGGPHEFRIENHRHRRTGAVAGPDHSRRDPAAVLARRDPSRQRQRGERRGVRRRDGGTRHRRAHRRSECPALRGAGGVLRPGARPEPQILFVLLQGTDLHAAGGGGRSVAPDHRACRTRRRAGDPRTRLRLGLAVAVDGTAVSEQRNHRGVEFAFAAGLYRAGGGIARTEQSSRGHRRHERVRRRPPVRPHRVGRDVRAHDELARADGSGAFMAEAGRALLHAHLHPSLGCLSLRPADGEDWVAQHFFSQ